MKRVPPAYAAPLATVTAPASSRRARQPRTFIHRQTPPPARLRVFLASASHHAMNTATAYFGILRRTASAAFTRAHGLYTARSAQPVEKHIILPYYGPRRHLRAAAFATHALYATASAALLGAALIATTPDIKVPIPPLAKAAPVHVMTDSQLAAAIPPPDIPAISVPRELKAKPQGTLGTAEMFVPKPDAAPHDVLPLPPAPRPQKADGSLSAAFEKISAQTRISTGPAPKTLIGGEDVGLDVWKRHTEKPHLVAYSGDQPAGSILVDFTKRDLFFVVGDGKAVAYKIASPKPGMEPPARHYNVRGSTLWPSWTPTPSVLKSAPDLKAALQARHQTSIEGGQHNPMGSAALYLRNDKGVDEGFRIHGTNDPETIGEGASIGCIRLHNLDLTPAPNGFIDHKFPLYKLAAQVKGSISVTIYRNGEKVPGIGGAVPVAQPVGPRPGMS